MTRLRSLMAGVLVFGLLAGGAASAQGPGLNTGPRGDNPGPLQGFGRGGRLGGPGAELGLPIGQLNLSDAQRQQIRDLTQRRLQDNREFEERLRAAQEAMRKAAEAIPVNEGAIRAAAQNLALADADNTIQRAQLRAEIFGLLTPDQQAQVKKLQAERDSRAANRPERPERPQGGRRGQQQ